ncbi:MAG: isoprenyl transferase [Clostridiaceae bacterium]
MPDPKRIPKHIGIIMDGNGRWAKERKLPRSLGHKAGVETIRSIVKECNRLDVKYLTLYAFSTENWKRSAQEVGFLMDLLVLYLKNEFAELNSNNVIIDSIGEIDGLPKVCVAELKSAYERTKHNTGVHLYLALNYGGQREIVDAVKRAARDLKDGVLDEADLNEKSFSRYLYAGEVPEPELIIRPSGEKRLSNFMLYQSAYAEFWFSDIYWPDFSPSDLRQAILDYQSRDRRFGGVL